ncbi:MAG: hypothetical protein Q7R65_01300 [bacterium]|nr:hypothetical protein [bacterium]
MNKKTAIAILILVVILAGGGFLLWQNSQAAVKDLNATLPEGVRVVKSLFGNEYKVVNKLDGTENNCLFSAGILANPLWRA